MYINIGLPPTIEKAQLYNTALEFSSKNPQYFNIIIDEIVAKEPTYYYKLARIAQIYILLYSSRTYAIKKDRVNLIIQYRRFAHFSILNIIRASRIVNEMDIKGLLVLKYVCESYRIANAIVY